MNKIDGDFKLLLHSLGHIGIIENNNKIPKDEKLYNMWYNI